MMIHRFSPGDAEGSAWNIIPGDTESATSNSGAKNIDDINEPDEIDNTDDTGNVDDMVEVDDY